MAEYEHTITDPYYSDFEKSSEDEELARPEKKPEAKLGTIKEATTFLQKMAEQKGNEAHWADMPGGDPDLAEHHRKEQAALLDLQNKIFQKKWNEIDTEGKDEFSIKYLLANAAQEVELKKMFRPPEAIRQAEENLAHWQTIEALIRNYQK